MAGGGVGGKHRIPEVDLVPILDGMTSVIFFLILSSTFIQYTKITLPPSQIAPASAPPAENSPPPEPAMSPKIFTLKESKELILTLTWQGKTPDKIIKKIPIQAEGKRSIELYEAAKELGEEFKKKFPEEKNIQLGFSGVANYQQMLDVMDGIRKTIKDIVLLSSSEEAVVKKQVGL